MWGIYERLEYRRNTSVTKIVFEDGKFKLIKKGDISHLESVNKEIKQRFA